MYLFWLYNVCLSETREIGTKCTDGRNNTTYTRRIDENDIMFLCTPQVVGKPDIGIEFTDRKTLLPRVTYRNIEQGSKYELYIQLKSKKL
jgi:hypothetical protein